MPNICTTDYIFEGEERELDALYNTMNKLQNEDKTGLDSLIQALGKVPSELLDCRGSWISLERTGDTLRTTIESAWTPRYELHTMLKEAYPSLCIYYKAEEPGCEVYMKNDAEGKYFPETEVDGCPYELMTEKKEQQQIAILKAIKVGNIELVCSDPNFKPTETKE
jgi:hypothetical protein